MTVQAALKNNSLAEGLILTLVVPAFSGCNLACKGCYIKLRKEEAIYGHLGAFDYSRFIHETCGRGLVGAICIQGYEPLLAESFPFTEAIILSGNSCVVPVSLVTNGIHLKDRINRLAELQPTKIAVSLDATAPTSHDLLRGMSGAWELTIEGLETARDVLSCEIELAVASILRPKRVSDLEGMPLLLRSLGLHQWIVTAFQSVGRDQPGGPTGERWQLLQDVISLIRLSDQAGIGITIDDELGQLTKDYNGANVIDLAAYRIRQIKENTGIFRLLPTGECSTGLDILRQVPSNTLSWFPGSIHASEFLDKVRQRANS